MEWVKGQTLRDILDEQPEKCLEVDTILGEDVGSHSDLFELGMMLHEDRAYADIAQHLSLSLCNTRKRVQQARMKVKQQLGEYLRQEI